MITFCRCLLLALLCQPLAVSLVMADSWTVWPTTQHNCTGFTDHAAKHDGPILIQGGATSGTVRKGNGYLKFDISAIPDGTPVAAVEFNYYVNAALTPYWSVTPLDADPTSLAGTPELVWEDLEAESVSGYYNLLYEGSMYDPGWKTLVLGGSAGADLTALLAAGQDWFAFGGVSHDGSPSMMQEIDGHTGPNVPYLVVHESQPPANDTCAGAIVVPGTPGVTGYSGDTTFAANDYDCSAPCVGGLPHGGGDTAWAVTLPAGCEVCATLNQSAINWNGGLYLVTDCADVNGTCVAGASGWLAGGEDESFCYTAPVSETYYLIVDGRTGGGAGPFLLEVGVSCLSAPSDLLCVEAFNRVELSWINNDAYDVIEIYRDGNLLASLAGSETSFTAPPDAPGYHCFHLFAHSGTDSACSDTCCLIYGYNDVELLWDFEENDGGFLVEGTGAWEWGAATYGPCSETAFGKLWATSLHQDYGSRSCWLLDSPPVDTGVGCFLSFDHCYEAEFGADGGVLWFTTDDFWYNTSEPVKGTDGVITATPACTWVAGQKGFTGSSGGWVTDHWDFTDPMWHGQLLRLRFAFGSDDSITAPGWMIDNVTVYRPLTGATFDCDYTVTPVSGTVPFQTVHRITLNNSLVGGAVYTRRLAAQVAVTIGNGSYFNPWRAGYTNIAPSSSYHTQFSVNIPALASVIGSNRFSLFALDVTPAPYNQPPYPPAGTSCTKTSVVTAFQP